MPSKLAFLFKWDGRGFGGRGLLSRSLNPLFIQPGICFPTHLFTVRPVEGGCVWSNSPEGPSSRRALRFYAKLLFPWASSACCWSNHVVPRGGAWEHYVWGLDFSRTPPCNTKSYAVFVRQRLDLGSRWDKKGWLELQKTVPFSSNGRWKWGNLSSKLLQGFLELSPNHLFEHLWRTSISMISMKKQAPDYITKLTLTLPYCC